MLTGSLEELTLEATHAATEARRARGPRRAAGRLRVAGRTQTAPQAPDV